MNCDAKKIESEIKKLQNKYGVKNSNKFSIPIHNLITLGRVYSSEVEIRIIENTIVDKKLTPILDSLPEYTEDSKSMTYAGIGSRRGTKAVDSNGKPIYETMTEVAKYLESKGYTLRTGLTFKNKKEGADGAFIDGTKEDGSTRELYRPEDIKKDSIEWNVAKETHGNFEALIKNGDGPAKLMARNTNQVFGKDLDNPVDFVLAWTPLNNKGEAVTNYSQVYYGGTNNEHNTGGTGQAIILASKKGRPVINMADPKWQEQLDAVLKKDKDKPVRDKLESNKLPENVLSDISNNGILITNTEKGAVTAHNSNLGIYSKRVFKSDYVKGLDAQHHYGNPFLVTGYEKGKDKQYTKAGYIIKAGNEEEVSKRFANWLLKKSDLDVQPNRRDWIISQILDGKLDIKVIGNNTVPKQIIYYKKTSDLTHAKVLRNLINHKELLNKGVVNNNERTTKNNTQVNSSKKPVSNSKFVPYNNKVELIKKLYRSNVEKDMDKIYLFGDNEERTSGQNLIDIKDETKGRYPNITQAVIRGLPNTIGIVTVKNANTKDSTRFYETKDFDKFKKQVDTDLAVVENYLKEGKTIVLPSNGIGTGVSNLKTKAPKLYNYLANRLNLLTGNLTYMKILPYDNNNKIANLQLVLNEIFANTQDIGLQSKLLEYTNDLLENPSKDKLKEIKDYINKVKTNKVINIHSTEANGYDSLSNFNTGTVILDSNTIPVNNTDTEFITGHTEFATVEGAYQYIKAKFFGEHKIAEKILNLNKEGAKWNKPKDTGLKRNYTSGFAAKILGSNIKSKDKNLKKAWEEQTEAILKKIMLKYYTDNNSAKALLLSTGNKVLTHSGDKIPEYWSKKFPEILTNIRERLAKTDIEFSKDNNTLLKLVKLVPNDISRADKTAFNTISLVLESGKKLSENLEVKLLNIFSKYNINIPTKINGKEVGEKNVYLSTEFEDFPKSLKDTVDELPVAIALLVPSIIKNKEFTTYKDVENYLKSTDESTIKSENIITIEIPKTKSKPKDVVIHENFINDTYSTTLINNMENLIKTSTANNKSNTHNVQTQVAQVFGPIEYRYNGGKSTLIHKPKPMPKWLSELARKVESKLGVETGKYNHVLFNRFGKGVGIGNHQDAEGIYLDVNGNVGPVAIVSIGDTITDHKIGGNTITVPNGSLVEMNTGLLYHTVGKAKNNYRYSITFRQIPKNSMLDAMKSIEATDNINKKKAKEYIALLTSGRSVSKRIKEMVEFIQKNKNIKSSKNKDLDSIIDTYNKLQPAPKKAIQDILKDLVGTNKIKNNDLLQTLLENC